MKTRREAGPVQTVSQHSMDSVLPDGFEPVSQVSLPAWDFEANPFLQGEVLSVRTITLNPGSKREREARLAHIRTGGGAIAAVWESTSMRDLFDSMRPGDEVAIIYRGLMDVGRQQPMKKFECGIRRGSAVSKAVAQDDSEGFDDVGPVF